MQTLTEQLVGALEQLETVARSHCRLGEPGYDRKDVLAYCNEARSALDRWRADPEALLRENGEAVRRLGNELMAKQGKGR